EVQGFGGYFAAAADGILVVGVAAVDEDVTGVEERLELGDGVVHGFALGHHDPYGAPAFQKSNEILEGRDADVAGAGEPGNGFRVEVEAHDVVAAEPEAFSHVA